MEEKKKQGGKRRGAGRKPVMSKKKQYSFYIEGSMVLQFGSEDKFKKAVTDFIYGDGVEKDYSNPISELKDLPNYSVHDIKQTVEVKSTITGLPPKLSPFNDLMAELDKCETYGAVENVMKKAKGEAFIMRDKMALESKAKQIISEKGLYND